MSKTTKQITKIKLNGEGLKGLDVSYMHPQEKGGMIWNNEHVEKRKHPIHEDLENEINVLRNFMLELCGYYNENISVMEKDQLILDTKITEVVIGGAESFKISGELRTLGDKFIKVATPEVESADGYAYFGAVMAVIARITEETHEYMAGKKKLDEEAFMMKFAKMKNDDVTIKEFAKMSNTEKRDKCREILEKLGGVCLINEELDIEDINVQLEITEETKGVEAEIIPISTPMGEIIPLSVPEPVFIPEPIKVVEEQIPTQSIEIPIGAPVFKAPAF
jgi:hypothetical protein